MDGRLRWEVLLLYVTRSLRSERVDEARTTVSFVTSDTELEQWSIMSCVSMMHTLHFICVLFVQLSLCSIDIYIP
jgi:hypothetical protein